VRRIARGAGLGARVVAALEEAVLKYLGDLSVEVVLSASTSAADTGS